MHVVGEVLKESAVPEAGAILGEIPSAPTPEREDSTSQEPATTVASQSSVEPSAAEVPPVPTEGGAMQTQEQTTQVQAVQPPLPPQPSPYINQGYPAYQQPFIGYPQHPAYYPQYPPMQAHPQNPEFFHNNLAGFYAQGPPPRLQPQPPPHMQHSGLAFNPYGMFQPPPQQRMMYHQNFVQPPPQVKPPPVPEWEQPKEEIIYHPPPEITRPAKEREQKRKREREELDEMERQMEAKRIKLQQSIPRPVAEYTRKAEKFIKSALKETMPPKDLQQVFKFFAAANVLIADARHAGKKLTILTKISKWFGSRLCLLQELDGVKFEREETTLLVSLFGLQFSISELPNFEEYRALLTETKSDQMEILHHATDLFVLSQAKLDEKTLEERLMPIIQEMKSNKMMKQT